MAARVAAVPDSAEPLVTLATFVYANSSAVAQLHRLGRRQWPYAPYSARSAPTGRQPKRSLPGSPARLPAATARTPRSRPAIPAPSRESAGRPLPKVQAGERGPCAC